MTFKVGDVVTCEKYYPGQVFTITELSKGLFGGEIYAIFDGDDLESAYFEHIEYFNGVRYEDEEI
jgi:uncharacterized protein YodC (DUF2158 family)